MKTIVLKVMYEGEEYFTEIENLNDLVQGYSETIVCLADINGNQLTAFKCDVEFIGLAEGYNND